MSNLPSRIFRYRYEIWSLKQLFNNLNFQQRLKNTPSLFILSWAFTIFKENHCWIEYFCRSLTINVRIVTRLTTPQAENSKYTLRMFMLQEGKEINWKKLNKKKYFVAFHKKVFCWSFSSRFKENSALLIKTITFVQILLLFLLIYLMPHLYRFIKRNFTMTSYLNDPWLERARKIGNFPEKHICSPAYCFCCGKFLSSRVACTKEKLVALVSLADL